MSAAHSKRKLLRGYRRLMSKRGYWRIRGYLKSIGVWA